MRADSRLSRMLHVLLHMARSDRPLTSEQIADMLGTNPVVVRRTMAGLKQAGYVTSEKGHGGGWAIGCNLEDITLLDVHKAVGGPNIFSIGMKEAPSCAVERAVNHALSSALEEAETLLLARFSDVTLAELAENFKSICTTDGWPVEGFNARKAGGMKLSGGKPKPRSDARQAKQAPARKAAGSKI